MFKDENTAGAANLLRICNISILHCNSVKYQMVDLLLEAAEAPLPDPVLA
jgi:hypothetical protein